ALAIAETPRDLLRALAEAGSGGSAAFLADPEILEAGEAAPDRTQTLVEVLEWHARRHPGRRHVLFHGDGEPEELTYGELLRRARAAAQGIRAGGLERGQAVGLMLPSGLDYFVAFFGVLLAGGVPVPLYPPARRSQIEDHLRRQAGILATAQAGLLITFGDVLPLARLLRAQVPEVRRVTTVAELSTAPRASSPAGHPEEPAPPQPEDVAFLQFTSGSTGNPKGVILTHANLLANLRALGQVAEIRPDDVVVSWLPLYHDMGLIGAWMGSLYFGLPLILMSPLAFLARPSRWLQAIHHHRGTISAAPNFAYELCAAKIPDEELQGLDLSSWRTAFNGAEPVSPEAIRRFTERFAPYGFQEGMMTPVYGLAENSLAVTFQVPGRPPRIDAVRREPFQRGDRAEPAAPGDPAALHFVSCGPPIPTVQVRIVDGTGNEAGERRVGRLQFRSPSATSGYFRNPEATRRLFHGDWLDSGDLAYIAEGELYLTGRVKDMIIRAGRNLYPQEIEEAVGAIPGIRKGCVAAFGSADPATGTERLVILAETRERDEAALERLRQAVQDTAVDLLGTPADDVVLAPPQTVLKTSSGKIRRQASRELYEGGRIGKGGTALWWQLVRLAGSGLSTRLSRRARVLGDYLYAARVYFVVALVALPAWAAMTLTPGTSRRRRLARRAARLLARAGGMFPRVHGLLDDDGPRLLVANHQSYLDGILLTAALPARFAYVVKRELENAPGAGGFLRRLGTVFVERFDPAQSAGESRKVLDALRAGDSVVIFPEGTFQRQPGLLPFRMGAFLVAAEAGVPVVPVTIHGTRSMLRDEGFFFRRGTPQVTVGPALHPEGTGWDAAVCLRDAARREILSHCGEPDLGAGG
ncbi:MAG TPA: AMP-binding protein, partial [Thermoanaerobaculia bacterium]|nr:AMP-binding protein [Thermoanaerobaculia bacterium]